MSLNSIALLVFILVCGYQAATVTWTGDGKWTTDITNWSTGAAPTAADDVQISSGNLEIEATADITVNTIEFSSSGAKLTVSGKLTTFEITQYYGTVEVPAGGSISANNSDENARYYDDYYGNLVVAGTVSIRVENAYGTVNVTAGGVIEKAEITSSSADLNIEPTGQVMDLTVTSGNVNILTSADGASADIESFVISGGNINLETDAVVNVTKNFNATGSTNINGAGHFNLGADTIQSVYSLYLNDDVVFSNWGWLETDESTTVGVYLDGNAQLANYGSFIANSRVYFEAYTTSFHNWGEVTSDDDGTTTFSEACSFYAYTYWTEGRPNVTNYEEGNITCSEIRVYYVEVDNMGNLMVESIALSGDEDYTFITISQDQDDLSIYGYGTVTFRGELTIGSLRTDSGSLTIKNEGGNTTFNSYNSSSTNKWTSGEEGAWFKFVGFYQTEYYEYLENAWLWFEDDTNQTSNAYWYFTNSKVESLGHFLHDGSYWTFYDNSTFLNRGIFESLSSFSIGQTSGTELGRFISVGVSKFWNGASFNVHYGSCSGGLVVLADTSDTTFYYSTVSVNERFAVDGEIELEFGAEVPDDYALTYQSTFYWYSSTYDEDFDSDGIPKTIQYHGDYDVTVRAEEGVDTHDFKDLDTCFTEYGLYVYTPGKGSSTLGCKKPSDFEEGICGDEDWPEATVDIENPTTGTASSMIFSVLSVFIIAAFFTLF